MSGADPGFPIEGRGFEVGTFERKHVKTKELAPDEGGEEGCGALAVPLP